MVAAYVKLVALKHDLIPLVTENTSRFFREIIATQNYNDAIIV